MKLIIDLDRDEYSDSYLQFASLKRGGGGGNHKLILFLVCNNFCKITYQL